MDIGASITNPTMTTVKPLRTATHLSCVLAGVTFTASALAFTFWELFSRDVPMVVGNLRGTALMVIVATAIMLAAIPYARHGSTRAWYVWAASLGYIAYNAVMFNFSLHFNSLFLLFAAMLALVFWSLVSLLRASNISEIAAASSNVPRRIVAGYMLFCVVAFAVLWLMSIAPATLSNTMPPSLVEAGLPQNTVWVLDFAFTFPLMTIASIWLLQKRDWGFVLAGILPLMLAIETAGVVVDQWFGHLHDASAPLSAIPPLIGFTVAGALVSWLFLRRVVDAPVRSTHIDTLLRPSMP